MFVSCEKGVLIWGGNFGLGFYLFLLLNLMAQIQSAYFYVSFEIKVNFPFSCSKDFFSLPEMAIFFFLRYKLQFTVPFVLSRTLENHNFHALQTNIEFIEICKPV